MVMLKVGIDLYTTEVLPQDVEEEVKLQKGAIATIGSDFDAVKKVVYFALSYEQQLSSRIEALYYKAKEVKNFFTQQEIDDLRLYQFQNAHRCKFQTTSSNIQPIVDITDMFANLKWLTPKFEEIFGKDSFAKEHSGNFYITAQPHDAHVDLPTEDEEENRWFDNLIPWKSVIVPLFLETVSLNTLR